MSEVEVIGTNGWGRIVFEFSVETNDDGNGATFSNDDGMFIHTDFEPKLSFDGHEIPLARLAELASADVEPVVHEPCEFCGGEKTEYSDSAYGKFSILKDRLVGWCIAAEFSQCPPFADCAVKNMKLTHLRQIKHCPNCGRKLDMDERSNA